jgi:hypothetical protein
MNFKKLTGYLDSFYAEKFLGGVIYAEQIQGSAGRT